MVTYPQLVILHFPIDRTAHTLQPTICILHRTVTILHHIIPSLHHTMHTTIHHSMPTVPVNFIMLPVTFSHKETTEFQEYSQHYHYLLQFRCCHLPVTLSQVTMMMIPLTLQKLSGKIRKCYGCTSNIRDDTSTIPNPPYDLVVRYKERRYYRDTSTQTLKLTKNEENTYYHPMQRCIQMKHPSFNANMLYIPAITFYLFTNHTYLITLAFISRLFH